MNVLWLNHRDIKHPRAGGAERTIMELSKRLYPKNIHLTLVTGGYIGNNANDNDQKYELLILDYSIFGRRLALRISPELPED